MATTLSLVIQSGNEPAREISVPPSGLTFGRQEPSDIVIPDTILSRLQMRIEEKNGTWIVTDLDSRNGTALNGTRITTAALTSGDRIHAGNTTITIGTVLAPEDMAPSADTPQALLAIPDMPKMPPLTALPQSSGPIVAQESVPTGTKRFCGTCGAAISENAKFCSGCGQTTASGSGLCPKCGCKLPQQGKFCPQCGAACSGQAGLPTHATTRNGDMVLPLSLGVIMLCGFLVPGLSQILCGQKYKGAVLFVFTTIVIFGAPILGFFCWLCSGVDGVMVAIAVRDRKPINPWDIFPR